MSAKKKEDKGEVGKRKRGEKRHFVSARPTPRPLAAAMAATTTTTGEKKKEISFSSGALVCSQGEVWDLPKQNSQKMFFPKNIWKSF